ncbi:hypothetical protein Psuf_021200 [Phytohabitans suffuscus]|uniref:Uncharacterized protein n=1 Tax=Phytohabitans suffuscus TaxID=624315 RepID=A0A6F8YFG0_9ACTN|nr:hypothetical protein Psuf_021200 [Phytohabitans suffuscus]
MEDAGAVDRELLGPVGVAGGQHAARTEHAGDAGELGDGAQPRLHGLDGRVDLVGAAHVGLDGDPGPPVPRKAGGDAVEAAAGQVEQAHRAPLPGQRARDRLADAAGRAGHQCNIMSHLVIRQ